MVAYLETALGIECGGTTPDGLFTLTTMECLGSCDTAPMMQVNEINYDHLDEKRIDTILDELRTQARA